MQDFATRSLKISEETPEVAMELLTEDVEVCFFLPCSNLWFVQCVSSYYLFCFPHYSQPRKVQTCFMFQDAANAENLLAHYGLKRRWETRCTVPYLHSLCTLIDVLTVAVSSHFI